MKSSIGGATWDLREAVVVPHLHDVGQHVAQREAVSGRNRIAETTQLRRQVHSLGVDVIPGALAEVNQANSEGRLDVVVSKALSVKLCDLSRDLQSHLHQSLAADLRIATKVFERLPWAVLHQES